jgi:ABC-type sugar transport system ATPase subunit
MADVSLKNIVKQYGDCKIIDGLSLDIKSGEFVTLLGPSGCGKTTLLRMIAGLTDIDKGDVLIGGRRFNDVPAQHRRIAMVFQSYALFPHMTVLENVVFGLKIRKVPAAFLADKVSWVMPLLGLEGLEGRFPRDISGGQRQRVALARALVLDPDVLLLDEPLSNLDAALRESAMEELKRIHRKVGKTIIYVTHNQAEAMSMSERIALINCGRLEQYDTPDIVYDIPETVFAAQFIGSPLMNLFEGEITSASGIPAVSTPAGVFLLDRQHNDRILSLKNSRITAGIRPQNLLPATETAARRHSDTTIQVNVEITESLGDRDLVVSRTQNGTLIRFLAASEDEIEAGNTLSIRIDGRKIHLFDSVTRRNILK